MELTCQKVPHVGDGYLHAEDDDRVYDVDGAAYCGRCHRWIGAHEDAPVLIRADTKDWIGRWGRSGE